MVISQPPGIILHKYYGRAHQRCLQLFECFQRHLFYMQLQTSGVTHRNGATHIFYTNQIHGGIISRLFFIHLSLHALALHLAVKILLQIFLYGRFEHVGLTYICRLYFLQNASRTALNMQPILLSENIPNIWHKSSTNTRRSDQIETIKTIM